MAAIWIASLADYNNGYLVGQWVPIDADTSADDLHAAASDVLASSKVSGAEEYAVFDADGLPSTLGEYTPLDTYAAVGAFLESASSEVERAARLAFLDNDAYLLELDADELDASFEDSYRGTFDSLKDYAEQLLDELGMFDAVEAVGLNPAYVDVEAFARDLQMGGDVWTSRTELGTAVFGNY